MLLGSKRAIKPPLQPSESSVLRVTTPNEAHILCLWACLCHVKRGQRRRGHRLQHQQEETERSHHTVAEDRDLTVGGFTSTCGSAPLAASASQK